MPKETDNAALTTGDAARSLRIPRHRLAYAFEAGHIPEPPRIGGRRMIPVEMMPSIARALGLEDKRPGVEG